MRLRGDVQAVVDRMKAMDDRDGSIERARLYLRKVSAFGGDPEAVWRVEELTTPVRMRAYRPGPDAQTVAVYFHGGWFCAGDLETHDSALRAMANRSGAIILAVEYRLAPEHPFPAGLEDCEAAAVWARERYRGMKFVLAGDSAGGALAAVVASKLGCDLQVLIYPVADSRLQTDSWREFGEGPVLSRAAGVAAWSRYVPNAKLRQHPDASPCFAGDLSSAPPALVITAELDALRDEGEAYGRRLPNAEVIRYADMIHGFLLMRALLPDTDRMLDQIAQRIRGL